MPALTPPNPPAPETVETLTSDEAAVAMIHSLREELFQASKRLLSDFPDEIDSLTIMGSVHCQLGNTAAAVKCWQQCLDHDAGCIDAYKGLGSVALQKGQYEEAAAAWRAALAIDPRAVGIHYDLACAMMHLGNPEEAVVALEADIEISPGSSRSHFLLGQAYGQRGESEKAKQSYLAAIAIAPTLWNAHYRLAIVCARLGEKDEAKKYQQTFKELKREELRALIDQCRAFDDLAKVRTDVARALVNTAGIYYKNKRPKRAMTLWRRAATIDTNNWPSRKALLLLSQASGDNAGILRLSQELIAIRPDEPSHRLALGMAFVRAQRFAAAEEAFRKACQLAPDDSRGYTALANLFLYISRHVGGADNRIPEAATLAAKAVALSPTAANYAILSQARDLSGRHADALAAIQRAAELQPENAEYQRFHELLKNRY